MRTYRRRLWMFLFGAVVLTAACAGDLVARAHEYVASGDRYVSRQQLKEAVIEYGNAVKVQPAWAEAHYKRRRAYLSLNDPYHAYQSYAALKRDSGSVEGQYLAGLAALAEQRPDDAELAFEQVVALNPRAAAAHRQLARLRLARGDTGRALTAAERATSLDPLDQTAALLKVRALRAQGDLAGARRELAAHIARDPDAGALRVELGWVSLQQRDVAGARRAFEATLEGTDAIDDARAGLIAADLTAGNIAPARARVDKWLSQSPRDVRLRTLSAQVLVAAHRQDDAARVLQDIVVEDPSQLDAYGLGSGCSRALTRGPLGATGRNPTPQRQPEGTTRSFGSNRPL